MFTVEELEEILNSKEFREQLLETMNKQYFLEIEEANLNWKVNENEAQDFINRIINNRNQQRTYPSYSYDTFSILYCLFA